jgi:hypothetical protein
MVWDGITLSRARVPCFRMMNRSSNSPAVLSPLRWASMSVQQGTGDSPPTIAGDPLAQSNSKEE